LVPRDGSCVDESVTIHVGRRRKKRNYKYENYHFIRSEHRYDFIAYGDDDIDTSLQESLEVSYIE
jgi:hypothetical protein